MSATEMPKSLFEALARFQMDLPKIAKGETANVPTKQGGSYSYKYADLTDVSAAVLPKLGAVGLAFIARPTTQEDGKFGLAYSLAHVSGDREDGFYEINAHGMTPQQIGGLITYARRYCLCAVTGIAPGGDDDDAQAANQVAAGRQSAADAFETAAPAPARQNGSRPSNQGPRAAGEQSIDQDSQAFADEAHNATDAETIAGIHERARVARKLAGNVRNQESGGIGQLALYLNWRRKQLKDSAPAQLDPDDQWAVAFKEATDAVEAERLLGDLRRQAAEGKVAAARAALIERLAEELFPGLTTTEARAAA